MFHRSSSVTYCSLSVSLQGLRRFSCTLHRESLSRVCIVLRLKLLFVLYELQNPPRTVMVFREQVKDKGHILECMSCLLLRFMNSYPLNWDIQDQCWATHTMRHMLTICPSTRFRPHYPGNQPRKYLGIWHLDIGDQDTLLWDLPGFQGSPPLFLPSIDFIVFKRVYLQVKNVSVQSRSFWPLTTMWAW